MPCSSQSKKTLFIRWLLALSGLLSLGLGIIGIWLPGLPTTPFLLLAAYCFYRSSERLYQWLTHHRIFGNYMAGFRNNGFTRRKLVISLLIMWLMITLSVTVFIKSVYIKIIVLFIGVTGTVCMWFYARKSELNR